VKTILILEDEPSVLKLLRLVLKHYHVIEATTAEQAFRVFARGDCRVDLLLTDVRLPTLSGIQVALQIRLGLPDLPVLLVTGYPSGGWRGVDAEDLERLGPHSVVLLPKPFQAQALLSAVDELLGATLIGTAGAVGY
jgi:CheY-like chemotaxis protein